MRRRENLKLLLTGGVGTGLLFTAACKSESIDKLKDGSADNASYYGRIPEEIERDKKLNAQAGFSPKEMEVISIISEIIVPVDKDCIGAKAAGVPAFIDFIAKDIPEHNLPIKGGIMWIENESMTRYKKPFSDINNEDRITIIDDIAYPDTSKPEHSQGVKFFNLMRNLTLTGYFTTESGLKDLGYQGNVPNEWDGVPTEVLAKHNLSYEDPWKNLYIKKENRNKVAQWDDKGKLI